MIVSRYGHAPSVQAEAHRLELAPAEVRVGLRPIRRDPHEAALFEVGHPVFEFLTVLICRIFGARRA